MSQYRRRAESISRACTWPEPPIGQEGFTPGFPPLLNAQETATNARLGELTSRYGAHTFVKPRIKDVLPLDHSGIRSDLYSFALRSHFDFVVTDDALCPLFAVEFDGEYHRMEVQRARDESKDAICRHFAFPILRINSRYFREVARNMDLLSWCVHCWFWQRNLNEAQDAGELPADEPFLATDVLYDQVLGGTFPLFLSQPARAELRSLARRHRGLDPIPSCLSCWDERDNLHVMACVHVSDSHALFTTAGMREQSFPIPLSEVVEDVAVVELVDDVKAYIAGRRSATRLEVLDERIARFQKGRRLGHMSGIIRERGPNQR